MDVPGAHQQRGRYVSGGQRAHRPGRGEDRPVPARRQRHGHPGGRIAAHRHGAGVDSFGGQLPEHEPARRVVADRRGQRHPQPQPRRGHRGDRGGPADLQRDAVHQLFLLAERGGDVTADDHHVGIAVPDDQQVKRAVPGFPGRAALRR